MILYSNIESITRQGKSRLADHTKVAPLADYKEKSLDEKLARLKDFVFAKKWVLYTGMPTSDVTLAVSS